VNRATRGAATAALLFLCLALSACSRGLGAGADPAPRDLVDAVERIERKVEAGNTTPQQDAAAAEVRALMVELRAQADAAEKARAALVNHSTNPVNWTPAGAAAALALLAQFIGKQNQRNESERRLRKAISDFDALPENVEVKEDGTVVPVRPAA
jgi:hypothetical protein